MIIDTSQIFFEEIQLADLSKLMIIEHKAYLVPWQLVSMQDCLKNHPYTQYINHKMIYQNQILGYGFVSILLGESNLLNLTIHPDYQQQGLGQRMLAYLIQQVEKYQGTEMFLEVRVSNKQAIKLYHKMGFNELSVRKSYYPIFESKRREDAIVMAKTIQLF